MIAKGAYINEEDEFTALSYASNKEVISLLIDNGANLDKTFKHYFKNSGYISAQYNFEGKIN